MMILNVDKMTSQNAGSDFVLRLTFKNGEGELQPFPFGDYDFKLIFTTPWSTKSYLAWKEGDTLHNCHLHDGVLCVPFKNHGLSGAIGVRIIADIPDSCFVDGQRHIDERYPLNVILTEDANSGLVAAATVDVPVVVRTAYDLAKAQGYAGTPEEYAAAMTVLPDTLKKTEALNASFNNAIDELRPVVEDASKLRSDFEGKQDKLISSPSIIVNPDNTLSITELAEKALFIKMWNARCILYGDGAPEVRGRYNPETDLFELNGLTDITYEQAVDILTHPVVYNDNMYNFYHTKQRTHLPPYYARSNQTYNISGMTFHTTKMESIRLPGCAASGYWDDGYGTLKFLSLTGIKEARVLLYKKNLEHFRWEWQGNTGTSARPRISLNVAGSPKLDWESYNQLISGMWDGTNTISLTVCSEAYAKIMGDTSVTAVAALDQTEAELWQSLVTKAQAKNIVLATA